MEEYTHKVKNSLGMHARPAGMFVKLSKQYRSVVYIGKGDKSANVNRILAVMGMGIQQGDEVRFTANGEDEHEVLEEIRKICAEIL